MFKRQKYSPITGMIFALFLVLLSSESFAGFLDDIVKAINKAAKGADNVAESVVDNIKSVGRQGGNTPPPTAAEAPSVSTTTGPKGPPPEANPLSLPPSSEPQQRSVFQSPPIGGVMSGNDGPVPSTVVRTTPINGSSPLPLNGAPSLRPRKPAPQLGSRNSDMQITLRQNGSPPVSSTTTSSPPSSPPNEYGSVHLPPPDYESASGALNSSSGKYDATDIPIQGPPSSADPSSMDL